MLKNWIKQQISRNSKIENNLKVVNITVKSWLVEVAYTFVSYECISTSNYMFVRAIWDKLVEYVFENFENLQVLHFQNFQISRGWFIPKITRTKHVTTG